MKTAFEIFIRSGTLQPRIHGDEHPDNQREDRRVCDECQPDFQAFAVNDGRVEHETIGRKESRHHGESDREPTHRVAGFEEFVAGLIASKPDAQPDGHQEICENDEIIEWCHGRDSGGRRE